MSRPKMRNIERLNYVLTGVATIVCVLTQGRAFTLGFAVGGGLTCLNFFVLRNLIDKWLDDAAKGRGSNASYLMLPKMAGLMAAVAVALLVLHLDPIGFVIGYSIFLVSIAIEVAYASFRQDDIDG
ncbi:MAG TPA: ATP synthase subunit I [Kofleriaceae bacterium]